EASESQGVEGGAAGGADATASGAAAPSSEVTAGVAPADGAASQAGAPGAADAAVNDAAAAAGQSGTAPTAAPSDPEASTQAAPEPSATDASAQPEAATDADDPDRIIISHGIGTFGDVALPADFTHLPYVNPDAPKGGEFSTAWVGGFDSFNPYTIRGRPEVLSSRPMESLLTGTSDEIGSAYCLICETIEYPASRDWVIFNLREGVTFSDGSPLTADDVMFSYETFRDKGLSAFRNIVTQQIASAEVLDERRIRYDFVEGYPRRELIQTIGGLPVLSRADFEENNRDLADSMATPLLGSGPYRVASVNMGRNVVYERNPDYWGADLPINRGRNNYDRIRIEYFADADTAFEAFSAGEYTFRNENSSVFWATRYDIPGVRSGAIVRDVLEDGSRVSTQGFWFNLRREKFADARVRQAIGLMFNFEWSNESLFYGLYERVESFWGNSEMEASGPPSPEEIAILEPLAADLPSDILTADAVLPPESSTRQPDRHNLRVAAALLDDAGWTLGSDGLRRNEAGALLSVEFLESDDIFERILAPYVENLLAVGIDARITRVDDAEYENRRRTRDYDILSQRIALAHEPGDELISRFGSDGVDGEFSNTGLSNPAVDAIIDQIVAAGTREELQLRVRVLDRVLRSLYIWVPQWYKATHTVAYYDQYEYPQTMPPYALGELDFWWINAEKAAQLRSSGALRR
ncbi:MAG: extracellular solute-binding protein, partial [Paracoccus sp. (in: a-proteobacteria)]|nr:extracellular solute-binding protein [Paracoccus sp. (in: a-proteobacteria)]